MWETLKCTIIRDLQLALLFNAQKDNACMCVKKHVVDAETMDKETPATMTAFVGIHMTRNECKECIMVEEHPEVEKFDPVTIEFGD